MELLTDRQSEVLKFIQGYMQQYGFAPSLTELGLALNIGTKRGVVNHLTALEKKGVILRTREARGIQITKEIASEKLAEVTILGYANAGLPMVYAEAKTLGSIRIDRSLLPISKDIFALEIKGDSMNKRLINDVALSDGNFAIISKTGSIKNGDVILAIVDECATIKTVKKDNRMIVLYPESSNIKHKPMYFSSGETEIIAGKVIAVLENPGWGGA